MRKILLMSLCALSLLSCPTPTPDPMVTDADVVMPTEVTVVGGNWMVTLPSAWEQQTSLPNGKNVKLVAENKKFEGLVILSQQSYTGTSDQFAIDSIRKLRDQCTKIEKTVSVSINDNPFVAVESVKDNIMVMTWVTVKSGFAYTLECGGDEANIDLLSTDCQKIADSLKIK